MSPTEAKEIGRRMNDIERTLDALNAKIDALQSDVAETKEIVSAWRSVKHFGALLKWLAGIITAGGLLWAAAKGVFHK